MDGVEGKNTLGVTTGNDWFNEWEIQGTGFSHLESAQTIKRYWKGMSGFD